MVQRRPYGRMSPAMIHLPGKYTMSQNAVIYAVVRHRLEYRCSSIVVAITSPWRFALRKVPPCGSVSSLALALGIEDKRNDEAAKWLVLGRERLV